MYKFNTFKFGSMTNAYHISTHHSLSELLTTYGDTQLGIAEALLTKYRGKMKELQNKVKQSTSSSNTELLRAADTERDQLFRYIRNVLSNLENSPTPALSETFPLVKAQILDIYPASLINEADNVQTALIRGFVEDIHRYLQEHLAAYGITDALTKLGESNDRFQQLYLQRVVEQSNNDSGLTLKLRGEVDELFLQMEVILEYWANQEATDENAANVTKAQEFIKVSNELSVRIWQSIKLGKTLSDQGEKPATDNPSANKPTDKPASGKTDTGTSSGSGSSNSGSNSNTGGSSSRVPDPGSFL